MDRVNQLIIALNSINPLWYVLVPLMLVLAWLVILAAGELQRGSVISVDAPAPTQDSAQLRDLARRYESRADNLKMLDLVPGRGDLGLSSEHLRDIAKGYERAAKGLPR